MSAWLALIAAGALTFIAKALPAGLGGRRAPAATLQRATALVSPALLGALAARGFAGTATQAGGVAVACAGVVGAAAAVRTRSVPVTLIAGLVAFGVAGALVG